MRFPFTGWRARRQRSAPLAERDWCLVSPRELFASADARDWEGRCRRMTFNAYVGEDTIFCRALARFDMYVSTRDQGLGPHLIGKGYWEMWVTRVVAKTVRPGMVCIDVGANIGYYSLLMAELSRPDGRVIAAEPVPATRRLLERNVRFNGYDGMTTILGTAFGAAQGDAPMYVPPGEPKNAQIFLGGPIPGWEEIRVSVQSIDDLALARIDFVKIDVEGAEIDVWQGMQRTLDQNPEIIILMEVNCQRYPAAVDFLAEIEARFPLRFIDHAGFHAPITRDQLLSVQGDVMLYLHRS